MPTHIQRCTKCLTYTISEGKCKTCESPLENVFPARFSLQDKYQDYRIDFFKKKMKLKFPELAKE
jgi:rRNA maturation protein Nop10